MADEAKGATAPEEQEGKIDVSQAVINCFADVLERDPATIKPEDRLEVDLRINTSQVLQFTLKLEKAIGLKFSISDIRRHRTVAKVIKMVQRYADA